MKKVILGLLVAFGMAQAVDMDDKKLQDWLNMAMKQAECAPLFNNRVCLAENLQVAYKMGISPLRIAEMWSHNMVMLSPKQYQNEFLIHRYPYGSFVYGVKEIEGRDNNLILNVVLRNGFKIDKSKRGYMGKLGQCRATTEVEAGEVYQVIDCPLDFIQ